MCKRVDTNYLVNCLTIKTGKHVTTRETLTGLLYCTKGFTTFWQLTFTSTLSHNWLLTQNDMCHDHTWDVVICYSITKNNSKMIKQTYKFNHSGASRHREKHTLQLLVAMFHKSHFPLMRTKLPFSCKVYVKITYILFIFQSIYYICSNWWMFYVLLSYPLFFVFCFFF